MIRILLQSRVWPIGFRIMSSFVQVVIFLERAELLANSVQKSVSELL